MHGLASPATGSYRDYVSCAPRPQLAGRRAASMGDVRARNDLEISECDPLHILLKVDRI